MSLVSQINLALTRIGTEFKTIRTELAAVRAPADFVWIHKIGTRSSTGDLPALEVQRAFTISKVVFQFDTASGASDTVGVLRNGSAVSGSSLTVTAANQATGSGTRVNRTATFTQTYSVGDTFAISNTPGATPGKTLIAWVYGSWV